MRIAEEEATGRLYKSWSWFDNHSPDKDPEIMFMIKHKGLMFDPDCSWMATTIFSKNKEESGDQNSYLLYNIIRENGEIVDAVMKIVSKEDFETKYIQY